MRYSVYSAERKAVGYYYKPAENEASPTKTMRLLPPSASGVGSPPFACLRSWERTARCSAAGFGGRADAAAGSDGPVGPVGPVGPGSRGLVAPDNDELPVLC